MTSAKKPRSKASNRREPNQLSVDELNAIAQKSVGATGVRGEKLKPQYLEGFYGRKVATPAATVSTAKVGRVGKRRVRTKLKRAGFAVGSADEFLRLTARESKLVDRRIERGGGGAT